MQQPNLPAERWREGVTLRVSDERNQTKGQTMSDERNHMGNLTSESCGERVSDRGQSTGYVDYKALYHELIMAVEKKTPNETRHETALRYITEREKHCECDSHRTVTYMENNSTY